MLTTPWNSPEYPTHPEEPDQEAALLVLKEDNETLS